MMTTPQQLVLLQAMATAFAVVGTVAYVETRDDLDREAARRERYATLAGSVVTSGIIGATFLALNAEDDGLHGNIG